MPARRCTTGPSGAITLPQFLENKDVISHVNGCEMTSMDMSFRVPFSVVSTWEKNIIWNVL